MRVLGWLLLGLFLGVAGFAGYVRLAPQDVERWRLAGEMAETGDRASAGGFRAVRDYAGSMDDVETVILRSARTERLADWGHERLYVTRSALWGFPDYASVRLEGGRLEIFSRLRFGRSDLGVNQARVRGWLADLQL